MRDSSMHLNNQIVEQWINDASMNILMISQYYESSILYIFVLAILDKGYEVVNHYFAHS